MREPVEWYSWFKLSWRVCFVPERKNAGITSLTWIQKLVTGLQDDKTITFRPSFQEKSFVTYESFPV